MIQGIRFTASFHSMVNISIQHYQGTNLIVQEIRKILVPHQPYLLWTSEINSEFNRVNHSMASFFELVSNGCEIEMTKYDPTHQFDSCFIRFK